MSWISQMISAHAVVVLVVISALTWAGATLVWWVTQRCGPTLWGIASRVWERASASDLWGRARRVVWLRAIFSRSLDVWHYLGLHSVVSFVMAFSALAGFLALADEVRVGEDFAELDERLVGELRKHVSPATLQTFAVITRLGDLNVLTAIVLLGSLVLALRRRWLNLGLWLLATAGGGLLVLGLKATFARQRPFHDHALTDSSGWSFPSGHASGAALVYGTLGYLIVRHAPRAWHIPITVIAVALVVFVGFSRVILQVHYLSDVLAGFSVAGAWLGLSAAAFAVLHRRPHTPRKETDDAQ